MSQSVHSTFTHTLPKKPNLNQLRKQAKELLRSYQASEPAAVTQVNGHFPRPISDIQRKLFRLSDAQLVLARIYGFDSWPKLKAFVDGVTVGRFMAAVQSGDISRVRAMLRHRPELVHKDAVENNEHRSLHYAVLRRDVPMVRMLMKGGADARQGIWPHRDATTAYALARERDYQDIVAVIEEEEQSRRAGMSCPNSAVSPVQEEINQCIRRGDAVTAKRLLEADRSLINACDRGGGTPLHAAAQATDKEMAEWLLGHGAKANKQDIAGMTPLDRSALAADPRNECAQRFPSVAKLLIDRGAEVTLRAAVALAHASRVRELVSGDPEVLRRDISWTSGGLLTMAVKHGHIEMVRLLLDLGADVDERTILKEVEEPTESWGAPLWFAALAGRRDIAELLLDRGADPNANVYASGWPLRNAYQRRDEALKKLLVERGAKAPPYMVAEAGDVTEARRLLETNTSEELATELTWSAAVNGCPAIVELALPHLNRPASDPRWHWILIQPFRGVGDNSGLRPVVSTDERLACLAILLRHKIDVNVARLGQTVLHFTAAREGLENESDRVRFAAMLVDAGGRLDLRDDLLKSTPLGWACRWGRKELVAFLISRGAPVIEHDAEPWATPLAWARKMGHEAIERLLHSRGAKA
ncbi:MAG TPA: ankyrin repeat domain-containing protein [Terriglobia bacterium]|nr:ankyrin repeat domain-containing protein [Terriglobia bacterium]